MNAPRARAWNVVAGAIVLDAWKAVDALPRAELFRLSRMDVHVTDTNCDWMIYDARHFLASLARNRIENGRIEARNARRAAKVRK